MACGACGSKKPAKEVYEHTDATGKVTPYAAEALARAAVARRGGTYVKK